MRDLEFLDCILEEGDMLYIPPKWWHYVRSLTTSLSVSFWWSEYGSSQLLVDLEVQLCLVYSFWYRYKTEGSCQFQKYYFLIYTTFCSILHHMIRLTDV